MATEFSYVVRVTKNIDRIAILTLIAKASFDKKMATPVGISLTHSTENLPDAYRAPLLGMATGAGLSKTHLQPHPRHPAQIHPRPHPRVKYRTRRVSGGFRVTREFEQSGGEFNHKSTMY
jgi:hypothetical protein